MIDFTLFSLNLFLLSVFFYNPIFNIFVKNNKIKKNYLNYHQLIFLVILSNLFILFSFFTFFTENIKIIFYFFLLTSILSYSLLIKKYLSKSFLIELIFIFAISLLLSINIFSNPSLGWDGNFWIEKTQLFYEGKSFKSLNETIFPYYPQFGSFIWAFFWKSGLQNYEIVGRSAYIIIYVISIFSLCSHQKLNDLEKFLFSIILIFLTYKFEHFTGYQDILIFSFIIFSYILFENYKKNSNIINLIIFNLSIFILLWIKNEGIIAYFVFLVLFLLENKKNNSNLNLLIFLTLFSFLLFIKFIFFLDLNNELVFQRGISIFNFYSNLISVEILIYKLLIILKFFLIKIFYIPLFLIFFVLIFFSQKIKKREIIFFGLIFILYSLPYLFSSDSTDQERIVWHLQTSYDRMLLQCGAFVLPFVLKNLRSFIKYN